MLRLGSNVICGDLFHAQNVCGTCNYIQWKFDILLRACIVEKAPDVVDNDLLDFPPRLGFLRHL